MTEQSLETAPAPASRSGAYDVREETDPLRAAAYIITDLFSATMNHDPSRAEACQRLRNGDDSRLYSVERLAIAWIEQQLARDPDTIIGARGGMLIQDFRAAQERATNGK